MSSGVQPVATLSPTQLRETVRAFRAYVRREEARIARDEAFLVNMYVSPASLRPEVPLEVTQAAHASLVAYSRKG